MFYSFTNDAFFEVYFLKVETTGFIRYGWVCGHVRSVTLISTGIIGKVYTSDINWNEVEPIERP